MNTFRFDIFRNFCRAAQDGELTSANAGAACGRCLMRVPADKLRAFSRLVRTEFGDEPAIIERGKNAEVTITRRDSDEVLLRFIAGMPLSGEAADATRQLVSAFGELSGRVVPGSLRLQGRTLSLSYEYFDDGDRESSLIKVREILKRAGFGVELNAASKDPVSQNPSG